MKSNRQLVWMFAGIDRTVIKYNTYDTDTGNNPWVQRLVDVQGGKGKKLRISGFTFDGSGIKNAGKPVAIGIRGSYSG